MRGHRTTRRIPRGRGAPTASALAALAMWICLVAVEAGSPRHPDAHVAMPSGSAQAQPVPAGDWGVSFLDVAEAAGLRQPSVYGGLEQKRFIIEANGAGVGLFDADDDGWVDVFLLNGTRLEAGMRRDVAWPDDERPTARLYRNNRDGTFTDITAPSGLAKTGWGSGVCVGDYDNDGRLDLFTTYFGQNVLYRALGGGRFEDVTDKARVATEGRRWGSGCTFVDYDRDGRLDLFVANYLAFDLGRAPEPGQGINCLWKGIPVNCGPRGLPTDTNLLYRNRGDGTFTDVSSASGIARVTGRYAMTAVAADLDGDGWPDIYVASDSTAAILYRNNRDGTFTDVAVESGAGLDAHGNAQAGMGIAVGDIDADGRLDLLKTHFADDIPALYRALADGRFEDVAMAFGLGVQNRHIQWGVGLPDLDNDGLMDAMYVTGSVYPEVEPALPQYPHRGPRVIFRNRGGRFEEVSERSGPAALARHSSRGAAFGDIDNDGDLDVLVMNMNEAPSLLRNDYRGPNTWLSVQLEATISNRAAIGAIIRVTSAGRTQAKAVLSQSSYYSHDDRRAHFGLGAASRADAIEVQWPSGKTEVVRDVPARRFVTIREGQGLVRGTR